MTPLLKTLAIAGISVLVLISVIDASASSSRRAAEAEQARLDQACEDAREKILSVEPSSLRSAWQTSSRATTGPAVSAFTRTTATPRLVAEPRCTWICQSAWPPTRTVRVGSL